MLAGVFSSGCVSQSSAYRGQLAAYESESDGVERRIDDGQGLFEQDDVLSAAAVVDAAISRNPSIRAAQEGWRAALAIYPQATAFDDPTLSYTFAPLSVASSEVDYGQIVDLSVPLPFPGKRRLRGEVALAEADAARYEVDRVRLRVALMAVQLYYDLYATTRSIEITTEFEAELEAHRKALTAHLAAGHAWQDDALKVEVDLGETSQRRLDLEGQRDILRAQLNQLLHRQPETPLPPMPRTLIAPEAVSSSSLELQEIALKARPELGSAGARLAAGDASIAAAQREFYPDFRILGRYNSMWPQLEHELMAGVAVAIPIWRERREAAVQGARAMRNRRAAELDASTVRIRADVERAYQAHRAALAVLAKLREDILPAARDRTKSIRVGLYSGRTTFIEVLRADHDLLSATLHYELALANAHRRHAELEVSVGRLGLAEGGAS